MLCVGAGLGVAVARFGATAVEWERTVACGVVKEFDGRRTRALRDLARRVDAAAWPAFGAGEVAAAGAAVDAAADEPTPLPATRLTIAPAPTSEPTPAITVITCTLRRARSRPSTLRQRCGVMSPLFVLPG